MKLTSRPATTKITVLTLLLVCMVGSSAEAWFCPDCDPARVRSAQSTDVSGCPSSQEVLAYDQGAATHESEMADVCPLCQSPSHVATSYTPTILTFVNSASQDAPHLSGETAGFIYKPPRIAS